MSLPNGFAGSGETPEVADERKCKLGFNCHWQATKCPIHKWTDNHDEAVLGLQIFGSIAVLLVVVIFGVGYYVDIGHDKEMALISGLPCEKIWEYIMNDPHIDMMEYFVNRCN